MRRAPCCVRGSPLIEGRKEVERREEEEEDMSEEEEDSESEEYEDDYGNDFDMSGV